MHLYLFSIIIIGSSIEKSKKVLSLIDNSL